ncbi:MAG: imidazoleglycerol-phosphate dehydratase [Opitutales bacterium]|nr:imidazoleglycerol-phosphate dehydratase [Opitutales bacterium]|tara:strand:+ start:806 stop:1408 length:603 start_codon:yes stop_codon:yes gene_type:complete
MAAKRTGEIIRKTDETDVRVSLSLDGSGKYQVDTGIPFLDHMLELFAKHGFFDLKVQAKGDVEVDYHHLVEDIGLSLGQALSAALGDRSGITRYGFFVLTMDESQVTVALDLSNRPYLVYEVETSERFVRDFSIDLFKEFFQALANDAGANLHIKLDRGKEPHHASEAVFKGFAKALDSATQLEPRLKGEVPSTKGTLSS